jgi:hypothetical protein
MGVDFGALRSAIADWLFYTGPYADRPRTPAPVLDVQDDVSAKEEISQEPTPTAPISTPTRPMQVPRILEELPETPIYKFNLLFTATTAKDPGIQESNEDSSSWDEHGNRAAVFDGATESFAAQRWSRLLARHWKSESDWIAASQREYEDGLAAFELSWAQAAAAERGSFSTIAAVQASTGGLICTIVGDSCVFLINESRIVRSVPFTEEAQFSSAPFALASAQVDSDNNAQVMAESEWRIAIPESTIDQVLLATDAVSAWLLSDDQDERLAKLLSCSSDEEFSSLVHEERTNGRMKTDDSTVIRLSLEVSQ